MCITLGSLAAGSAAAILSAALDFVTLTVLIFSRGGSWQVLYPSMGAVSFGVVFIPPVAVAATAPTNLIQRVVEFPLRRPFNVWVSLRMSNLHRVQ